MSSNKTSQIDVVLAKKGMYWSDSTPLGKYLEAGSDNIKRKEFAKTNPFLARKVDSSGIKKTYTIIHRKSDNSAKVVIHAVAK